MNQATDQKLELLQDRYGIRLSARLSDAADQLPCDITERLRAARVQAVDRRKREKVVPAHAVVALGGATLALGAHDEGLGWPTGLASMLMLVALVAGLLAIQTGIDDLEANELAEVDAAILTDDLPPSAYADPGFAQYLRSSGNRP